MSHIGFIGLGHMGLPMALNLLKAGYSVLGYDLNPLAQKKWMQEGGVLASNLNTLAQEANVIITMLQTHQQVQSVLCGELGLFRYASSSTLFIDCSTIDAQASLAIEQDALKHDINMIDAPVSGGVKGAQAGTLTFMVGAKPSLFEQATPILNAMGKTIIHTGARGTGVAAKICNNMILGVSMIAISEAFNLAEKLGLSPEKLFEVVNQSSGQCWAMSRYVPVPHLLPDVPANQKFEPGFAAKMMYKDLLLSQDAAKLTHTKTPLGKKATQVYQAMLEQGDGELDFSAIIELLKRSNPN